MKGIILCADDYAFNAAVDAGIVQLVEMGRLSAVGCMTESPRWLDRDNRLPQLRDRIDIGLHFNLTQKFPPQQLPPQHSADDEKQPLPQLLRRALLGTVSRQTIADSLHAQLDRFETVMGDAPDFVDGHQHVHIFPHIRKTVLETLARRYRLRRPWLRQVNPSLERGADWNKRLLLSLLNQRFEHAAHRQAFHCNKAFAGIYSLQTTANFPLLMRHWLTHSAEGTLLMCHPGQNASNNPDRSVADEIAATRPLELAWLAGAEFPALLERERIRLSRFRDLA
jgi:predicted glycoside hydrolase/deacetylase ChbG (UPF0249 family)